MDPYQPPGCTLRVIGTMTGISTLRKAIAATTCQQPSQVFPPLPLLVVELNNKTVIKINYKDHPKFTVFYRHQFRQLSTVFFLQCITVF